METHGLSDAGIEIRHVLSRGPGINRGGALRLFVLSKVGGIDLFLQFGVASRVLEEKVENGRQCNRTGKIGKLALPLEHFKAVPYSRAL